MDPKSIELVPLTEKHAEDLSPGITQHIAYGLLQRIALAQAAALQYDDKLVWMFASDVAEPLRELRATLLMLLQPIFPEGVPRAEKRKHAGLALTGTMSIVQHLMQAASTIASSQNEGAAPDDAECIAEKEIAYRRSMLYCILGTVEGMLEDRRFAAAFVPSQLH